MLPVNVIASLVILGATSSTGLQQYLQGPCTDDNRCWTRFRPINDIMEQPNFQRMVNSKGKLNLTCGYSAISEAESCDQDDFITCVHGFRKNALLVAWKHFCENQRVIEARPFCWSSDTIIPIIRKCVGRQRMDIVPSCIRDNLADVAVCGPTIGALFHDLLVKLYAAYMDGRH